MTSCTLNVVCQIEVAREIKYARLGLMQVPGNISFKRIKPHSTQFVETIIPISCRDTKIMHCAREQAKRLLVEKKMIILDRKITQGFCILSLKFRGCTL